MYIRFLFVSYPIIPLMSSFGLVFIFKKIKRSKIIIGLLLLSMIILSLKNSIITNLFIHPGSISALKYLRTMDNLNNLFIAGNTYSMPIFSQLHKYNFEFIF